jgi:uncharacterized protein
MLGASEGPVTEGLPELLKGLMSPGAYPHPVRAVQLIETHVSWVLLTGEFAYKIKRPVQYAFIDLRCEERRAHFCHEELRLNRRFAPELYVEVCVIREQGGQATLLGSGRVIEHAVRMRQFDREEELDRLLAAGRIEAQELSAFGASLAGIHACVSVTSGSGTRGRPEKIRVQVQENLEECIQAAAVFGTGEELASLREPMARQLEQLAPHMARRLEEGFVRECHGDLHSRNIVRRKGRLLAFDCMEFEPEFRWIDVAEEIAFLVADLQAQDFRSAGHAFLCGYLSASGDYESVRLLELYKAHRALERAKVVALSTEKDTRLYHGYVRTARESLEPKHPRLILMSGLSGSGKTWLASRLAPQLNAIHIRSDVERKRHAGLAPTARAGAPPEQGLYSATATTQVHECLAQAATHVLAGGYTLIVDASFNRRQERERFRNLAATCGVQLQLVRCQAPEATLRKRIQSRAASARDASDADLAVLQWQQQHAEVIDPGEGIDVLDVQASDEVHPSIGELARSLGG